MRMVNGRVDGVSYSVGDSCVQRGEHLGSLLALALASGLFLLGRHDGGRVAC